MKKSDKLILISVGYFTALLISVSLVKNLAIGALIAFLITVLAERVTTLIMSRYKKTTMMPIGKMEELLALMGSEQTDLFINVTPPYFEPEKIENCFIITQNCEKVLVCPNYRFSNCSNEDVAKFYRMAKKHNINKVRVLSKLNSRSTIMFARSLDIEFEFVSSRAVRKYLFNHNALPEAINKFSVKKESFVKEFMKKSSAQKWEFFSMMFTKKRAKYFFISSVSTSLIGLFTPYKWYYITVSIITLIGGVVCLVRENA